MVWKLTGDGAHPRDPLLVVKRPHPGEASSSRHGGCPFRGCWPSTSGCGNALPRGLMEAWPVHHTPGTIQRPSPCPSACPGAGFTIRISQVMHSPRAHRPLAELLSPGSRPQALCCDTSSGSGHWHESWLRKAVYSGTMLPGKSTKSLFYSFSKRLPVRKGAPSLHLAAGPLNLPLGTPSPQPPWSASQTS